MIGIAIWFTIMVMYTVDVVLDVVNERDGWGPVGNAIFLGIAVYFFFDHLKDEFLGDDGNDA